MAVGRNDYSDQQNSVDATYLVWGRFSVFKDWNKGIFTLGNNPPVNPSVELTLQQSVQVAPKLLELCKTLFVWDLLPPKVLSLFSLHASPTLSSRVVDNDVFKLHRRDAKLIRRSTTEDLRYWALLPPQLIPTPPSHRTDHCALILLFTRFKELHFLHAL